MLEPFTPVATAAATRSSLCDSMPSKQSSAVGSCADMGMPCASATLQASTRVVEVELDEVCSTGPSQVAPSLLGPDTTRLLLPWRFKGAVQMTGSSVGSTFGGGFLTEMETSTRESLFQLPHSSTHSEEQ